ncbi:MAG: hypothetical protein VYC11_02250, partial [Candidatus Thermoplasmatota archaeon]|nr:hypothetical protein [Candidatus Thermoplasmatota archaeon]
GQWACTEMACSPTSDASSSDGLSMVAWSTIIIAFITMLLVGVLVIRRFGSKVTDDFSNGLTSNHAPCTTCGGPAHEAVNNGNKWTWCPTCRKWLNYIGKA